MTNSIGRLILAGATWAALSGITFAQSNTPAGAGAPNSQANPQRTPEAQPGTRTAPNEQRTQPETQPSNRTTASNSQQNSDLMKAIETNVAEVSMGKQAETRAQNPKVKAFAQKMVKDHSEALTKLKAIPGAPATEVKPNAEHQKAADMTAKMTGASFDKDYIDMMVKDHQEALTFLEQQSHNDTEAAPSSSGTSDRVTNSRTNNTLASVARELLPTVREHLREAQDLQKEIGSNASVTPSKR